MGDGMSELVGPVLRMSDDIDGIVAAIRDDNPDREVTVTDRGAYVRIEAPGFLRVTRESVARYLGRDFELRRLETMMSAFAGRIDNRTDEITWAYKNDLSATAAKPAH
jgi:toluene monooxygenase system protein D